MEDAEAARVVWVNSDDNGMDDEKGAGIVTTSDWTCRASLVFPGAEISALIRDILLGADKGLIIFVLEMLGAAGMAMANASMWRGCLVVFLTDSHNVMCALLSLYYSNVYVRYALRVMT